MSDIAIHIPGWAILLASVAFVLPGPILVMLPSRIARARGAARILAVLAMALAAGAYGVLLLVEGDTGVRTGAGLGLASILCWLGSFAASGFRHGWIDAGVAVLALVAGLIVLGWPG